MGTSLDVTATTDLGSLGDLDVVAFPVASLNGTIVVPAGLPAEVAGATLPSAIDVAFAARHRFPRPARLALPATARRPGSGRPFR